MAIYLEATRKDRAACSAVELIDKLVQALTSTSAALLLAADDITSCSMPPRAGGRGHQRQSGLCGQVGAFCGRVRVSSALSIAATVSVSESVYTRHVPVAAMLALAPAATDVNVNVEHRHQGRRGKKEAEEKPNVVELIVPEKRTEEVKTKEDTKEKLKRRKVRTKLRRTRRAAKRRKRTTKQTRTNSAAGRRCRHRLVRRRRRCRHRGAGARG